MRRFLIEKGVTVNVIELPDDWTGAEGEWQPPEGVTVEETALLDGKFVPDPDPPVEVRVRTRLDDLRDKAKADAISDAELREATVLLLKGGA